MSILYNYAGLMLHKPPVLLIRGVTQHLQPFRTTPAQLSVTLSVGPPMQHDLHSASNTVNVPKKVGKNGNVPLLTPFFMIFFSVNIGIHSFVCGVPLGLSRALVILQSCRSQSFCSCCFYLP